MEPPSVRSFIAVFLCVLRPGIPDHVTNAEIYDNYIKDCGE